MANQLHWRSALLLCIAFMWQCDLSAQITVDVTSGSAGTRAALAVRSGVSEVTLYGLQPGNPCRIVALRTSTEQLADFSLKLSEKQSVQAAGNSGDNTIWFTPDGTTASLNLYATSPVKTDDIPLYLSVMQENLQTGKDKPGSNAESQALLQTTPNVNPQSLIANTLIGGGCYAVSNVTAKGNSSAKGTFSGGSQNIQLSSGLVMSTGNVNILPGPNLAGDSDGGFGTPGYDASLDALVVGNLYDVNVIEFDFVPTGSMVEFEYVFGSEEYCEYVGSEYNDVFGFFISGPGINGVKNLAVLPGGTTPISVNSINHDTNTQYYVNNSTNFLSCNFMGWSASNYAEVELDGWTKPLKAIANVQPCQKYHIKLAIADVGDGLYDSAVFLKANSFSAGGQVAAAPAYAQNRPVASEGCVGGAIRFFRAGSTTNPLTVSYAVSPTSTAVAGTDYAPLPGMAVIPAGQNEVLVPVTIFNDGLPEGTEKIVLDISNSCQCETNQIEFLISDSEPLSLSVSGDALICELGESNLAALVTGGEAPYSYVWSNGATNPFTQVSPAASTTYSVTVTDFCGDTVSGSFSVDVLPFVRENISITVCAGEEVEIGGVFYTAPAVVNDTIFLNIPDCGQITTYTLQALPAAVGSETFTFCAGGSVTVNGQIYDTPGIFTDTLTAANGCDSVMTYTLVRRPPLAGAELILLCPGDQVTLDGISYSSEADIPVTYQTAAGCDSIVTYKLRYATPAPSTVSMNCPPSVTLNIPTGAPGVAVQYADPLAATNCTCPGTVVSMLSGQVSGSLFPVGVTQVCYRAEDVCGQSRTCCFSVTISEENPCDVKVIGCMKYELLSVTQDQGKNRTYRVRVTNNCARELIYTAFQLPSAITAMSPANNSIYTSPEGNAYQVRNPNYAPFYSVRFRPTGAGLANGATSVFRYTLPAQADVDYIHVISRLFEQQYYEAYLNTYYCPVGITPTDNLTDGSDERADGELTPDQISLFPNPSDGLFYADLSAWKGLDVTIQVYDSRGQRVVHTGTRAGDVPYLVTMPAGVPAGLYFVELGNNDGEKEVLKMVVER
ncbi:MAG: choice-of-anchor L domain-containing protein [Bacteroidota bacterium]